MKAATWMLFILMFASSWVQAQPLLDSVLVTDVKDCWSGTYAQYDQWRESVAGKIAAKNLPEKKLAKGVMKFERAFPQSRYEYFRHRITCETFIYQVDGLPVHGYVMRPANFDGELPVIVFNRGGNGNFGAVRFPNMMRTLFSLANHGYIVVGSQYRGTFQEPGSDIGKDEFGGKDIQDVREIFNLIPKIDGADVRRIGMFGHSRGGMQTFLTAKAGVPAKALVVAAGVSDLESGVESRPEMNKIFAMRIPAYMSNKSESLRQRSVINWVEMLDKKVPILLLHGSSDKRVSVEQSEKLDRRLGELGFIHDLVIFDGADHSFNGSQEAYIQAVDDWFKKYL